MKLASLLEKGMIPRMGFGAQGYNVGASLKSAFAEFYPAALDSYAEQIMNSNAAPETKDEAIKLLNSIKDKGEDLTTLLNDFNFDDKSDIGAELYRKLSGDTDEGEEGTLRFYDFNIDASLKSGMFENVVGLLDELDSFFYILMGMLGASGTQKKQYEPGEEPRIGFKLNKDRVNEKIREVIKNEIAECWKTHKQVGMKKKGDKMVPNCVPKNEHYYVDAVSENEEYCPSCTTNMEEGRKKGKCKPSKGKRFAKRVDGKCRSFGQKGKAKGGGDRIRPGTKKGHAYCARSAKIKKCKNPPCANTLSRKKWKCQGSRSVPE